MAASTEASKRSGEVRDANPASERSGGTMVVATVGSVHLPRSAVMTSSRCTASS